MKSYRVFAKREEYYVHDVEANSLEEAEAKVQPVSYTHLTLPTIYSV